MVMGMGASQAGGTWLEPSDMRIEPGDRVHFEATVGRGTLGWVDDGPFFLYLRGEEFGTVVGEGHGGAATDVLLAPLDLGTALADLAVTAEVTIPEGTPAGEYWITVCNEPCTTGLGDLIGALIYVGIDPPTAGGAQAVVAPATADSVTTTSAAVVTADRRPLSLRLSLAPYPDRPANLSPVWVGISAALAGAVLLTALLSRQRA